MILYQNNNFFATLQSSNLNTGSWANLSSVLSYLMLWINNGLSSWLATE